MENAGEPASRLPIAYCPLPTDNCPICLSSVLRPALPRMSLQRPSSTEDSSGDDRRGSLSAAADGQADALGTACLAWRSDPGARATWHAYHLIGDVLRSRELAAQPERDAAFLSRLRERLADEPVVLAPSLAAAPAVRRQASGWLVSAAVAAGFVVVAGVLVVSRVSAPVAPQGPETLAVAPVSGGVTQVSSRAALASSGQAAQADTTLIRDARLDEFLRAHQAARGGMAVAVPGSALRRVDVQLPAGALR